MKNTIKQSITGLTQQAHDAAAGLQLYGVPIGLSAINRDALVAETTAFILGEDVCKRERTEWSKRKAAVRSTVKVGQVFLRLVREALKPYLGTQYSTVWIEAGFDGSFRVPSNTDKVLSMLATVKTYLTAHPEQENEQLTVTGARAGTIRSDITNAMTGVTSQETILADAMTARNATGDTITGMLRDMIKDMTIKMDPMDNRWLSFGLNRPGQKQTPEVPTGLVAVLVGTNAVALKWSKAARAEHYRVWKRVVGVDNELIPVGSRTDLDFALEGLPAGATIELAVSAVNNGGESAVTEVVTVTTAA